MTRNTPRHPHIIHILCGPSVCIHIHAIPTSWAPNWFSHRGLLHLPGKADTAVRVLARDYDYVPFHKYSWVKKLYSHTYTILPGGRFPWQNWYACEGEWRRREERLHLSSPLVVRKTAVSSTGNFLRFQASVSPASPFYPAARHTLTSCTLLTLLPSFPPVWNVYKKRELN